MIRKIVIIGPESTGKTILAEKLAEHFQTVWVLEYLREFFDLNKGVTEMDIPHIAETQLHHETEAEKKANQILFCDTDLLSTMVYNKIYFEKIPIWMEGLMLKRKADLYLLLNCEVAWVPDPQRDKPYEREHIFSLFEYELNKRNLPFVIISGSNYDERFRIACEQVETLLSNS